MMTKVIQCKQSGAGEEEWVTVTPEKLAAFCVQRCGGGYTEEQTAEAMLMQREIMDGKEYRSAMTGFRIRCVEGEVVNE